MIRRALAVRLALTLALLGGMQSLALAQKKLQGVVTVINVDKGDITLVTGEEGAKFYDLKLAKDVKVKIGDIEGPLEVLKDCGFTTLELADDNKTVVSVTAQFYKEGDALGFVKAVDQAKVQLTVNRDNQDNDYQVAEKARVYLNGKPAKFADLKANTVVYMRMKNDEAVIVWAIKN